MLHNAREWVVDRFALRPLYDTLLDRPVPKIRWYLGDGAVLLTLLGVQVLTGMVLMLTYSPAAESAYHSVNYITHEQLLGNFIRGLHYWSAGMMVVMLFYHLFRQILMGGYKAPREGTWILGVLLFFSILLMAFTGYLLRWDERSVYGIRVMLHMISRVPALGDYLVVFIQGGEEMGPRTLTRFYALHVFIVPLVMFLLVTFHMYLIIIRGTITHTEQKQGAKTGEQQKAMYKEETHTQGEPFFPVTVFKEGIFVTLVMTLCLGLAILVGAPELYPEGNLEARSMPAEEWWYWWYSGLIALLPPSVAPWFVVVFPPLVFVALMALPFLDRGPNRGVRKRPVWLVIVLLLAVGIVALSDYRRRSAFTGWPSSEPPKVPQNVQLNPEAERGRHLFAKFGCNSCHAVAGDGRKVAVDFAELPEVRSDRHIRDYILQPPPDVAMPSYKDRLTDDELTALVAFCHVAQTFRRRP